ncbi:hypothetical protein ACE6H2_011686 [Prunus campanulata]
MSAVICELHSLSSLYTAYILITYVEQNLLRIDAQEKEEEEAKEIFGVAIMNDWDRWLVKWHVEFLGRQWNFVDLATLAGLVYLHYLAVLAPFYFTWPAFWSAVALYYISGVGVTLSFHRNLSHKSFKLPKWLEYFFAYCGVLSFQVLIELMAHGEGWHNNHHAFEYSAQHRFEWWQIDITWYLIRFLQAVGLATDVKLPTETQKKRRALCNKINEKSLKQK